MSKTRRREKTRGRRGFNYNGEVNRVLQRVWADRTARLRQLSSCRSQRVRSKSARGLRRTYVCTYVRRSPSTCYQPDENFSFDKLSSIVARIISSGRDVPRSTKRFIRISSCSTYVTIQLTITDTIIYRSFRRSTMRRKRRPVGFFTFFFHQNEPIVYRAWKFFGNRAPTISD